MAEPIRLPLLVQLVQKIEFPHKLGICEKFFAATLGKNGVCWVKTAIGPVWKLDLANSTHRWMVYGYYEGPAIFNWCRRNFSRKPVIVDSGANIGQTVLYFGTIFPDAEILAFEPGKYQADWFSECLSANPQLRITFLRKGLGDSSSQRYLQAIGHEHSHGGQNVVSTEPVGDPIEIVALSDILDAKGTASVDLWKLDVEGSEVSALRGAKSWLRDKRIRALWIETLGDNGQRICEFMKQNGYRGWSLDRSGSETNAPVYRGNTLFLPA